MADVVLEVFPLDGIRGLSTHVSAASNVSNKGSHEFVEHADVLHTAPEIRLWVQFSNTKNLAAYLKIMRVGGQAG